MSRKFLEGQITLLIAVQTYVRARSFTISHMYQGEFSTMIGIETKFRNKLQLPNFLRLKMTRVDVDVKAAINGNRKQAYSLHTHQYAFGRNRFIKLNSIKNLKNRKIKVVQI